MSLIAIEVKKLTGRTAQAGIEDITFSVSQGEVFGVVGRMGSGKTTLINILMGFLRPGSGSANLFGLDVSKEGPQARQHIGYMPNQPSFYGGMRIKKLVTQHAKAYGAFDAARMNALFERFALDPLLRAGTLNERDKHALSFVLALVHAPALLILDEPFADVDFATQRLMTETIRQEHSMGTTVFLTGKNLTDVQDLCDRAAVLNAGKLVSVEYMDDLSSRMLKRVRMVFEEEVPSFTLDGILDSASDERSIRFMYSGSMAELLRLLPELNPIDVQIDEPSIPDSLKTFGMEVGA